MQKVKKILLYDAGGHIGKDWYIEYPDDNGRKVRVKRGINKIKDEKLRREAAQRIMEELAERLGMPAELWVSRRDQFAAALDGFLERGRPFWRHKTYLDYRSKCSVLLGWMDDRRLSDLGEEEAREFELYLRTTRHKTTFNEYIRIFAAIWAEAFPLGRNYFKEMRKFGGDTKTPAMYFQQHQRRRLSRLLQDEEPYLWFFVQFIFYAFIRPGEIRQLRISDLLMDDRKILVRAEVSKNKRRQFVQMTEQLHAAILDSGILDYPDSNYIFSAGGTPGTRMIGIRHMNSRHQALLARHGFDTTIHKLYSWKHTGAVACYKAGMKVKDIQIQMRHANLEETDGYLRSLGINDVANDISSIFPTI